MRVLFVSEFDGFTGEDSHEAGGDFYFFRHYPGAGSSSMEWMAEPELAHRASVRWIGRVGMLRLVCASPYSAIGSEDVGDCPSPAQFLIGWHGGHGEEIWSAFSDLRMALQQCRDCPSLLVIGDEACGLSAAPLRGPRTVTEDDELARHTFRLIADRAGLEIQPPGVIIDSPGGPWADAAMVAPITRIPPGGLGDLQWASCLDYVLAPPHASTVIASWRCAPADHAVIMVDAPLPSRRLPRKRTTWNPCCPDVVQQAIAASRWDDLAFSVMPMALRAICGGLADRRTSRQRKQERVPLQARDLLARAAAVHSSAEQSVLRKRAWRIMRVQAD